MAKLSSGLFFCVFDLILAIVLLVLSLVPAMACVEAKYELWKIIKFDKEHCITAKPLERGIMAGPFCAALMALVFNLIWIGLQMSGSNRWSALQVGGEAKSHREGFVPVTETRRMMIPRLAVTISLIVLLLAGGIAGIVVGENEKKNLENISGLAEKLGLKADFYVAAPVWAAAFGILLVSLLVYVIETVILCIKSCRAKYDGE